jgi:hypothetical protein
VNGSGVTEISRVLTGNSFESLYKCMNLLTRPSTSARAQGGSTPLAASLGDREEAMLVHNAAANEIVERSFHAFIAELFLYALPKTLLFYPRQQIVGCFVERLLALLNGTSRAICSVIVETSAFTDLLRRHGVALELESAIIE